MSPAPRQAAKDSTAALTSRGLARVFAIASALLFFCFIILPSARRVTYGFGAYYSASRLLLEQRSMLILYDDDAFRVQVEQETAGAASDIFWANPPGAAFICIVCAPFRAEAARLLWTGVLLGALCIVLFNSARVLLGAQLSLDQFVMASSAFLISQPLIKNFEYGQAYMVLLALYALAWMFIQKQKDFLAGLCLGLALFLKASGLALVLLFLLRGQWKVIASAMLTLATFAAITLPRIGLDVWQRYLFEYLPQFMASNVFALPAYQTIAGFWSHLFILDRTWNPSPLIDRPLVARGLAALTSVLLIMIAVLSGRTRPATWTFAAGLLLSVLLIPAAEEHHYVLMFPAFLLVIRDRRLWPLTVLAGILIAAPLIFWPHAPWPTWSALLAYPRLYGGLLLFALLQINPSSSILSASSYDSPPH